MLIDTHCHLHDREFFAAEQAEEMLARAGNRGIGKTICIGTDITDSLAAHDFAIAAHDPAAPDVYCTFGIHPEQAHNLAEVKALAEQSAITLDALTAADSAKPPIAIGEVGLDYHYEGYNRDAQLRLLEVMLQLAEDRHLPLSFHVREAFPDFFGVIANFPAVRGVIHSFSDNKKHLRRLLETTDFYIGVNGLATYSTLPTPPLSRILLETDAPFLTPKPFRGIINETGYVREVSDWLSLKLGVDQALIEEETTQNAYQLFHFPDSVVRSA